MKVIPNHLVVELQSIAFRYPPIDSYIVPEIPPSVDIVKVITVAVMLPIARGINGYVNRLVLESHLAASRAGDFRKIVQVSRDVGKMVRAFRKASSDLTSQISKELDEEKKEAPPKQEKQLPSNQHEPSVQ